ncbi:hypothetical protein, partial [Enterococcus faecium]|uniref:hypothetical protein n=1 Tax=Enterococcus faecium TaxID=1352 RepID=UPI003F51E35C
MLHFHVFVCLFFFFLLWVCFFWWQLTIFKTQNAEYHEKLQEMQAFLSKSEKEKTALEQKLADIARLRK